MPMSVNIRGLHLDNFYVILIGEQNLCDFLLPIGWGICKL
jgi:hypothetical protein